MLFIKFTKNLIKTKTKKLFITDHLYIITINYTFLLKLDILLTNLDVVDKV